MIKLRPYQDDAIQEIAKHNGILLVNAPQGSGKTFIPLFLKKRYPKLKKMLIVCPASVKYQWESVIKTLFENSKPFVVNGLYDSKYKSSITQTDFVIVNYDILFSKKDVESWADVLSYAGFNIMVIDESHKVGNQDSNRSKSIYQLGLQIPYKVMLTATPLTSNVVGLWGQLHVLDPLRFASKNKFLNHFAPPVPKTIHVRGGGVKRVWKIGSVIHLEELQQLIREYCFIIQEDEVYKHLAGVQRIEIPCVIDDSKILNKISKLKSYSVNKSDDLRHAKDLLITSRMDLGKAKVNTAVSWVSEWLESSTSKIVVFAYHRAVVEAIADKLGSVAVKFYGGMGDKEKEQSKSAFINNPDVRVIVMNIDACTGVDGLNTVSYTCFYTETTSLPQLFDQSEGRVRRTNSTFDVYFTYILKADVLDNAILSVMWERKKLFKEIMSDGKSDVSIEDDSVEILKKLKENT